MSRVSREALLQALTRVDPGRSASNFIEQSTCFAFRDGWVFTFNDDLCYRTQTPLPEEFEGAVQGKALLDVLSNIGDEDIDVTIKDGGAELSVKGARRASGIRMTSEIYLKYDSVELPVEWVKIPDPPAFAEALKRACETAGKDDEEFMAVCVNLGPDHVQATDRSQAVRFEIPTGMPAGIFNVRAKFARHIAAMEPTRVGVTDSWVHFRNKSTVGSIRRQLIEYPDLKKAFVGAGEPAEIPKSAIEGSELARVFTADNKEDDRITVVLRAGEMTLRGMSEAGWATTQIETAYKGRPLEFRIGPEMLKTVVSRHNTCELTERRLVARGENWNYCASLGAPQETAPSGRKKVEVPEDDE